MELPFTYLGLPVGGNFSFLRLSVIIDKKETFGLER